MNWIVAPIRRHNGAGDGPERMRSITAPGWQPVGGALEEVVVPVGGVHVVGIGNAVAVLVVAVLEVGGGVLG